ncbi:MAG: hypothetical protein IPN79_16665 [Saprospiraceae bacterium]|nr:hypothetical protein [Saprospiraceae bacterium]
MTSNNLKIIILVFLSVSIIRTTYGQTKFRNDRYFVQYYYYGFKEGLTFGVKDMAMDDYGLLWLQNYDNLCTFNGNKFYYHFPDENNVFARPRRMTAIIADKNKKIWVASEKAIYTFKKSKGFLKNELFIRGESFDNITTLHANKNNKIWCGNTKGQIILYDPVMKCNLQEKTLPAPCKIQSIFEDSHDQVWVSCDLGLYVLKINGELKIVYDYKKKSSQSDLQSIKMSQLVHPQNEIVINLNHQLLHFDINNHFFIKSSEIVVNNKPYKINDFFELKDNIFFLATDHGIFNLNVKEKVVYPAQTSYKTNLYFEEDVVNKMILTDNSVLLFGTDKGLSKLQYTNEPIKNIFLEDESESKVVLAKEIDKWEKNWLLITLNGSIYRFVKNGRLLTKLAPAKKKTIQSICMSDDQHKLYTIIDSRLFEYEIKENSIGNPVFLLDTKIKNVKKITYDSLGNIWILSNSELHIYNKDQKKLKKTNVPNNELVDLEIFKNGRICVYGNALYCAENDGEFREISNISSEKIHDMEPGITNDVFFSGFSGLYHYSFDTKKTSLITMNNGMLSNDAGNIKMVDSSLWITYTSGLQKYDHLHKKFQSYNYEAGLKNNDCYDHNLFELSNEVLILGGMGYFTYYQKSRRSPLKAVDIKIESINFDNEQISGERYASNNLIVPAGVKQVQLKFDFPIFLQPSYYYMEYRLKSGKDSSWYKMPLNMTLQFYELTPNNYQIELRATDVYMPDFKKYFALNMEIIAPFYKKTSFQIFLFFLISSVVAIIFYWLYKFKLNQFKKLENIRMNISRDLHDEMGSELSSIKLISEYELMKGKSEENPSFKKIAEKSAVIMESMSDIVWSINPANDEMSKIIEKIQQYAFDILEANEVKILMNIDENVNKYSLNLDKRRHFYLLFKESINNIAKYAKANEVVIKFTMVGNILHASIEDDGDGFYILGKTQGNGLRNMKDRAKLIGAKIDIKSNIDKGTKIELSFNV